MVTNSQDYIAQLWQIQSQSPTKQAILLPKTERIFNVDLNSRTIDVPEFLSVEKDHQAETLYFKFDRYFDNADLTTKVCIIQYKNAKGEEYVYPVPFYDIRALAVENKVLIPWCIQGPATRYAGTIKFAIRFFQLNSEGKIIYDLNTLVTEGQILAGQDWDSNDISLNQITIDNEYIKLISEIKEISDSLNLYWTTV